MECPGKCGGCAGCGGKLGAYTEAPPLAFAGWRLRVGGNPPGGQYHGFLGAAGRPGPSPWDFFNPGHYSADGVYRSPGETPPSANPNRETNTVVVRHTRRRVGDSVVPGAFSPRLGYVDPCPGIPDQFRAACEAGFPQQVIAPSPQPVAIRPIAPAPKPVSNVRYPIAPILDHIPIVFSASTQPVLQPPPVDVPQPAPVVNNAPPPAGMYRDAAGNLTSDWHNPYSLYLPETIQPAPIVSADTSLTPGAGQMPTSVTGGSVQGNAVGAPSWFTDPNQELITGIPNWGLVAAAAAAFFLMKGRR